MRGKRDRAITWECCRGLPLSSMFSGLFFETKLLSRLSHKVCRLLSFPVLLRKFSVILKAKTKQLILYLIQNNAKKNNKNKNKLKLLTSSRTIYEQRLSTRYRFSVEERRTKSFNQLLQILSTTKLQLHRFTLASLREDTVKFF